MLIGSAILKPEENAFGTGAFRFHLGHRVYTRGFHLGHWCVFVCVGIYSNPRRKKTKYLKILYRGVLRMWPPT